MATKSTWIHAIIGGVITIVLSFTAFSPILGGGVAGYLQNESPKRGAKIGALSGLIAVIPLVFIVLFGLLFVMSIPRVFLLVLLGIPIVALWVVGLSAVGGYLGAYLQNERRPPTAEQEAAPGRTA